MLEIPPVDWKKAEIKIAYEGLYIFGGNLPDGNINDKIYILAIVPKKKVDPAIQRPDT